MTLTRNLPSSFLAIKGPLIDETYRAFQQWDLESSQKDNLARLAELNPIGASSSGWLTTVIDALKRRFDTSDFDRPLVQLAQNGCDLDIWRPVLLWHMTRTDRLLTDFLSDWLFDLKQEGVVIIKPEAARQFLREYLGKHLNGRPVWKENTLALAATGLLSAATDFHLLRGRQTKEFEAYRLPEQSFMYLLHAMMERDNTTQKVIHAADWRLFLMQSKEVEEELLRLHQYGKLHFERAGSFLELTLPYPSTAAFIKSMAA